MTLGYHPLMPQPLSASQWKAFGAAVVWVALYGLASWGLVEVTGLDPKFAALALPILTGIKQLIGSQVGDTTTNAIPVPFTQPQVEG